MRMFLILITVVLMSVSVFANEVDDKSKKELKKDTFSITVKITKIKGKKGVIRVGLYNKAKSFPKNKKVFKGIVVSDITGKVKEVIFKDIKKGKYAIAIFHDKNKNNKLDTNFFGAPKEGIGFSKNVSATFGPPSFKKASIYQSYS